MRLQDCDAWIQSWHDPDMHGGFRGKSASGASWPLALQLEQCKLEGKPMAAMALDIAKCVGQTSRELIYTIATIMGPLAPYLRHGRA